jgi:8-oxo-dGTP pyrophosphatase MutT (NUDIX family)
MRIDLDLIRTRLGARPGVVSDEPGSRAAVAMLLREGEQGAEILFIRRAEHPLDPWSGHMAFPGGRQDPEDAGDLYVTALRETAEEIGVDLHTHGTPLGHLTDIPAIARGKRLGMVIRPYVVELRGDPPIVPNHEVAEVMWAALSPIARGEVRTIYPYVYEGKPLELPGHRVGERVVWGLTHQMVEDLLTILRG